MKPLLSTLIKILERYIKKKEDLPVEYYWNSTSWMQVSVQNDYLTKLDKRMRLQNRKILLLVDNAPIHVIDENVRLTNVTIHFLPPTFATLRCRNY
jgi:hypothetical protein